MRASLTAAAAAAARGGATSGSEAAAAALRAPPVRFSALFGQMLDDCPTEVAAYGSCVARRLEHLEKDACVREFAALKACSERTLGALRAQNRTTTGGGAPAAN
jgi:hypothetical protein